MEEQILTSDGNQLSAIPREMWEQHLTKFPHEIKKMLTFMTKEHHQIRNFVVKELPAFGKPIPPELISEKLGIGLTKTNDILDELERKLFFLARNDQGEVLWAFPVTVDNTPHQLTFKTGERLNAA